MAGGSLPHARCHTRSCPPFSKPAARGRHRFRAEGDRLHRQVHHGVGAVRGSSRAQYVATHPDSSMPITIQLTNEQKPLGADTSAAATFQRTVSTADRAQRRSRGTAFSVMLKNTDQLFCLPTKTAYGCSPAYSRGEKRPSAAQLNEPS